MRRDGLIVVDAIDTGNKPTIQMFEAVGKYIIVAQANGFLVFLNMNRDYNDHDSKSRIGYGQMGPRKSEYVFLQHFDRSDESLSSTKNEH